MLPERLSNGLCSLREGENRATLAVRMVFGADGRKRSHRFVRGLIGHRKQREGQILRLLKEDVTAIPAMVARMYVGLDPRLNGAAGRSVLAHLIDLRARGLVAREGEQWRMAA